VNWQMIGVVVAVVGVVVTVVAIVVAVITQFVVTRRSERREEQGREEERQIAATEREREARERERKTIVHLINRLKPRRVLGPELDHVGEYYGRPELMIAAVNTIRDDLVYAGNELGENHKDIPLLQTMTESCNEFLTALEPFAGREDFTFGGPDFYRAIEEQHSTFIDDMREKIDELKQRNDIKS
jgi:hypothetical protein